MEVTHRSILNTAFAGGYGETWFTVTLQNGKRHLVSVLYPGTMAMAEGKTRKIAIQIWNRMTEYGFEAGLSTRVDAGVTITTQELKS